MVKVYEAEPPLKIGESSKGGNDWAYIYFEEYVDIPGLEDADVRIEFKNKNSFEDVSEILRILKDAGFRFVVQKNND
ncbi:hypothetical protein [Pectobacterium brasiliense]|uniref:hypothetical protein n=1 Tax=Pectobacterium brasiliense TaxID=180957 RepID=UPI0019D38FA8|nr:hypothetical protein [Pectobacterium brasiliense]MBN7764359.1 hypothetical protein [Pectobacterium brasiliense]